MKSTRLPWLLVLLLALFALRVVAPPHEPARPDIAQAVQRSAPASAAAATTQASEGPTQHLAPLEHEADRPGNAFAVRTPKPPSKVVAPPQQPAAIAVATVPPPAPAPVPAAPQPTAAPVAAPAPTPPIQVIGTWDDGGPRGVFVSTPQGTLLAREGATLLAEYSVVRINPADVRLVHMPSNRELQLPVPQVSSSVLRP